MGVTNSNKVADTAAICCGDSFKVTLALTAAPDIVTNPTDIVLVLDRSGSLSGPPFADMKAGAKTFIDIISESTGGSGSGEIGSGSRMAVVSFASTASVDAPLTTSVADLKAAVDALSAGGGTNHGDAFQKAQALFDPASANARTIVMFTDGVTTSGPAPGPIAAAARAAGTVIYCIGLIGSDGLDIAALNNWATDPDASHVAVTPDAAELEDLFAELAANISKPGATDVLILETLDADFELGEVEPPDKGSVIVTGPRSLRWSIDSLGTTKSESAALRFAVRHTGDATGSLHVNESIKYSDAEGNLVRFPDPEVYVDCGSDVYPEPCPEPRELILPSCTDSAEFDLGEFFVSPTGRIVELELSLCSVCPHRRIALAVQLYDGEEGGFSSLKTFELPAHCGPGCRDLRIRGIRFAVPDGACQCSRRALRARVLANYMDTDFNCADE